ncbi:MAG: hypothetical protein ACXVW6_10755 [Nocardioidaceae bacterium]
MPLSLGSAALLVLATLALVSPVSSSAAAAPGSTDYKIFVGHDIAAGNRHRPADAMSFLPGRISVHQGDTLTFTGDFHTATALPVGTHPQAWIRDNARRLGQRYFFLARDDEPGVFQFNPRVVYPRGCDPTGCAFDGSKLVNSGLLGAVAPSTVKLSVGVPAGHSFWVVCLLHPQMRLHVRVVGSGTAVQTQSQIDARVQHRLSRLTARATRLWDRLQTQHSHTTGSGRHVVDAFAGFDAPGLELFGMFPRVLHVSRGSTVMWHFDQLRYEPHSVVFPVRTADMIATGPPPQCEKDSGSGDVPATQQFTCPAGSHGPVEIELDPRLLQGGGSSAVTSPTGYHNSGARGGFDIPDSQPYLLRFPVASPRHGFRYACGVHGSMMTGVVKVR